MICYTPHFMQYLGASYCHMTQTEECREQTLRLWWCGRDLQRGAGNLHASVCEHSPRPSGCRVGRPNKGGQRGPSGGTAAPPAPGALTWLHSCRCSALRDKSRFPVCIHFTGGSLGKPDFFHVYTVPSSKYLRRISLVPRSLTLNKEPFYSQALGGCSLRKAWVRLALV